MPLYCDINGMVVRFGADEIKALTNLAGGNTIDRLRANRALFDASDEIDTYLSVRYGLPLAVVPHTIRRVCADIARYRLMDDRVTEEADKRYGQAIAWLKDIASGRAALSLEPGIKEDRYEMVASKNKDDRAFTRDTLSGF